MYTGTYVRIIIGCNINFIIGHRGIGTRGARGASAPLLDREGLMSKRWNCHARIGILY